MTDFLGVQVNEHGQPLWVPGDREAQRAFYRVFLDTEVGRQLSPFLSPETDKRMMRRILEIHRKWHRENAEVTLDTFTNVVQSLLATRDPEIMPEIVEPEVEVEPDVPRDRNGRPLTEAQIKWAEFTQFSNTHTIAEINARKRDDPAFASFVRKNLEREMAQPIYGAGVDLNARPTSSTEAPARLREFAARYLRTPADEARRLLSPVTNPANHAQYRRDLDAAIEAGLL